MTNLVKAERLLKQAEILMTSNIEDDIAEAHKTSEKLVAQFGMLINNTDDTRAKMIFQQCKDALHLIIGKLERVL